MKSAHLQARIAATLSALLLPLLFMPQAVAAQQAPPPPGPPRPFRLPVPTTITLENGVQATFVDFGVVPKVSVAISVRTGALNEDNRVWLSDLTGELMKEGTKQRTAEELTDAAAQMGARSASASATMKPRCLWMC